MCGIPLLPYQKTLCESLCRLSEDADAVIIAGDVFDTSVASAEAVKLWSEFATRLCLERKIPVIVCAGNHDGAARLASCAGLLRSSGLHISGSVEDAFVPVTVGNASIYSLPYFNPADAAAVLGCEPNAASVMKAVTEKILSRTDSPVNILAAHCFAAGASAAESDISARAAESVGGADKIPADAFSGFDYVALGHLHKAQTVSKNGAKTLIRYSGAPLPYSFGEARYKKTVTLVDTETLSVTELDVPQPYRLRTLEDSYENILETAKADPNRDDFMKITVTDSFAGDNIFMRLKELYPNLLQFSGMRPNASGDAETTAAETASEMDIVSLAVRYCEERRGEKPGEDELKWLSEALKELEEET